jgi:N6-L-threonylcarbamoyladenine synthase
MGLGYPGGPFLDQLSQHGQAQYKLPTPKPLGQFDFSYSGLKTAVSSLIQKETRLGKPIHQPNLAYAFQTIVVDSLVDKVNLALTQYSVASVVVGGGVSLNQTLRKQMQALSKIKNIPIIFPPAWACTDNAAMIALLGGVMLNAKQTSPLHLGVDPSWEIASSSLK